jgi:hypothetical protein
MVVNMLRRCKDVGQIIKFKEQRAGLTNQIQMRRKELKCTDGIVLRSENMKENLKKAVLEKQFAVNQQYKKKTITRGWAR